MSDHRYFLRYPCTMKRDNRLVDKIYEFVERRARSQRNLQVSGTVLKQNESVEVDYS